MKPIGSSFPADFVQRDRGARREQSTPRIRWRIIIRLTIVINAKSRYFVILHRYTSDSRDMRKLHAERNEDRGNLSEQQKEGNKQHVARKKCSDPFMKPLSSRCFFRWRKVQFTRTTIIVNVSWPNQTRGKQRFSQGKLRPVYDYDSDRSRLLIRHCSILLQIRNTDAKIPLHLVMLHLHRGCTLGMSGDNDRPSSKREWDAASKRRLCEAAGHRDRQRGGVRERTELVIRGPKVSEQGMLVPNEIGPSDHAGRLLGVLPGPARVLYAR